MPQIKLRLAILAIVLSQSTLLADGTDRSALEAAAEQDVAVVERRLAQYDQELAKLSKDHPPNGETITEVRAARDDYLTRVRPQFRSLLAARQSELKSMLNEMRPTATPVLTKQAEVFRLLRLAGELTEFSNSIGMRLVVIPAGSFDMGSPATETGRDNNETLHGVTLTKAFTTWENVATKFRIDAFNAFNHITAGNPGGNVESVGSIGGEGGGCGQGNDCGPRQLEFSLHIQF